MSRMDQSLDGKFEESIVSALSGKIDSAVSLGDLPALRAQVISLEDGPLQTALLQQLTAKKATLLAEPEGL